MTKKRQYYKSTNREYNDIFYQMKIDETLENLKDYCIYMASEVELLIKTNELVKHYLTESTLIRYKGTALTFSLPIKNSYFSDNNFDIKFSDLNGDINLAKQGLLIQYWTNLGALLESSLQMFLAVYHEDFLNSFWGNWNNKLLNSLK